MITPQLVKQLRDTTGAGMADCKKALTEAEGDMEKAVELLRKRGAASASKRSDRSTNEGLVLSVTTEDGKNGAIIEINCETDFVARNDDFIAFANAVADVALNHKPADFEAAKEVSLGDKTLGDLYNETLAKFSEKIVVNNMVSASTTDGQLIGYNHAGNRLAVMLEVSTPVSNEDNKAMLMDIAMQIAAMSPQYLNRDAVSADTIAAERKIFIEQAIESGKPENIAEKIAEGRLNKFFQEVALIEQTFVKDSSLNVAGVLKNISDSEGSTVEAVNFWRFELGSGN